MARILVVDDQPAMVEVISTLCRDKGHQVFPFTSAQKAIESMASVAPQLIISDMEMEKVKRRGFDVLRESRQLSPPPALIMITGFPDVETAVESMTSGARDYIIKPFKIDELEARIKNALELESAVRENVSLKKEFSKRVENIIGTSDRMQEIYNLIGKIADTDSTILIQGESGTGKELVARALHLNSSRQHQPFVAINCSALPENLLESELFGHKKGAFTGAVQDKVGLFEEAQRGTIFLDEINSMPQPLQTKLLRVLQERQIRRVGDNKNIPINVRVLAASNEALQEKLKTGAFREDLYYRLAVIPLEMPALRERIEDVPLLVYHFLQKNATQSSCEPKRIEDAALAILSRYPWPGNVRELENAIERACALCDEGCIRVSDLPPHVVRQAHSGEPVDPQGMTIGQPLDDFLRQQERQYIEETIHFNGGSREKAAKMLRISTATLYRKIDGKGARETAKA
jgi:two-component system response regulator AtoC